MNPLIIVLVLIIFVYCGCLYWLNSAYDSVVEGFPRGGRGGRRGSGRGARRSGRRSGSRRWSRRAFHRRHGSLGSGRRWSGRRWWNRRRPSTNAWYAYGGGGPSRGWWDPSWYPYEYEVVDGYRKKYAKYHNLRPENLEPAYYVTDVVSQDEGLAKCADMGFDCVMMGYDSANGLVYYFKNGHPTKLVKDLGFDTYFKQSS